MYCKGIRIKVEGEENLLADYNNNINISNVSSSNLKPPARDSNSFTAM